MQEIPIKAVAAQNFYVIINEQICSINIYTRGNYLYFDLAVNNASITRCTICRNIAKLVKQDYLGFNQNFIFLDTQGETDPFYTGLGTRYKLFYLDAEENAIFLEKTN